MPLSKLNEEQHAAATAPYGNNLIIASAGTGKTSTIVARIGYLLGKGVKPEDLLLLTFTNKASAEMVERVGRYFDEKVAKKIQAGTFHAISYKILKASGRKIVLKQPKELKMVLRSIHEKRNFSYFDSKVMPYSAGHLYDMHSLYQNMVSQESFGEWLSRQAPDHAIYAEVYEDIYEEFKELKKRFGYVDFNDLLIDFKAYLDEEGVKFQEILVDEYQDTNQLQGSLIDGFQRESLFCVGDYDQSIYGFNGADINIIGSFSERFENARVFSLNKNYRSSGQILSLANRVIEKNPRIYPKKLEVTREGDFPPPRLMIFEELFDQYSGIAQKIKASKTVHEDIAVIFRNNASADGIEAHLRELGINCKRKGGTSFFDTKEVKAMLDMFTILINPRDLMSFVHIFEYAKGVGGVFAKDIFDALYKVGNGNILEGIIHPKEKKNPFKRGIVNHQLGLFDEIIEEESAARFKKMGFEDKFLKNPILRHAKINKDLATYLHAFYLYVNSTIFLESPSQIVRSIVNSQLFGLISERLATKRAQQKDGTIDETMKKEALTNIRRKALLLQDLTKPYKDKYRFINALTLGGGELTEGEGVNLLSIHASKGLEFKEVYIVDLMDGRFPNRKLMSKNGGDIEEERRLFYVAVTRAKDILYLSYAKYDRVKKIDYIHSPFLVEAGMVKEAEAVTA
ncbi:MAG: ATP-dependent helicase [Sulfurospirillum sp.]|nr:MAG: ATP-dependent helicase [Sulfurospirillum sp.]